MKNNSSNSLLKRIFIIIVIAIIISFINKKDSGKNDYKTNNVRTVNSKSSYNDYHIKNELGNSNIGNNEIINDEMKKRGTLFCLGESFSIIEITSANFDSQGLLTDKISNTISEVGTSTYNLCINNGWRKERYKKRINEKNYTLGQVAFCMGFKSGGKDLADATYYQILNLGGDVSQYNPNENWDEYYYKCLENKLWEIIIPPEDKNKNKIGGNINCNIKGNIGFDSGEKIYHTPGCSHYNETIINTAYGERYFCNERQAIEAGWRKCYDYY